MSLKCSFINKFRGHRVNKKLFVSHFYGWSCVCVCRKSGLDEAGVGIWCRVLVLGGICLGEETEMHLY